MNKNTVERCVLKWVPDTYYWLAPGDRDQWLEVTKDTYDDATESDAAVVARLLREKIDGEDCVCGDEREHGHIFPLTARKSWLVQQGAFHDGTVFDTIS